MSTPDKHIDDLIKKLRAKNLTVLSAPGGQLPLAKKEQRELMCLMSDHTLLVRSGQTQNFEVLSYLDLVRRKTGKQVNVKTVTGTQLLNRLYAELSDAPAPKVKVLDTAGALSVNQMEVIRLITDAVNRKASDIHIKVNGSYGMIAYRIHGDMYKFQEPPGEKCREYCQTIYQSMCEIAEPTYKEHTHQDGRIKEAVVAKCGLFGARVASGPTDSGSHMVIRLLYDSGSSIPTLDQLGYLGEQIEMINTMRKHTSGINILSGATGSGKSTSLVSVMSMIIQDASNSGFASNNNGAEGFLGIEVLTIEDPPEYKIRGATQTPLVADRSSEESIRRGWANSIKASMRQDPDIMMIGEIRDPGSARAAFDAAMTGHGVWSTVHVTDAVGIMMRLRGLQVESDRMLDPEIVTGLINQSLVQKLCPVCSIPWAHNRHLVEEDLRNRVERYCELEGVRLRGPGCPHCKGEGIMGRMVIAEVILPNIGFMDAFSEHGKTKAKDYWVKHMNGITKCMAMIRRVNEGYLDPREAESKISAMDKDLITMGLDYSRQGDFAAGRARVLPVEHANPDLTTKFVAPPPYEKEEEAA